MTTFFDDDPKEFAGDSFIVDAKRALQGAYTHSGLRQQQVADKLEVDRSVVNRHLRDDSNTTLRSIGEMGWALGAVPRLVFDWPNVTANVSTVTLSSGAGAPVIMLREHKPNVPVSNPRPLNLSVANG